MIRVLKLMLPVTLALGLINLSLLINSLFGTLVSDQAPAAIDKAFRIYQLPQGLFSISIATILFPTLSRFAARGARDDLRRTMGNGVRQICLLLIPSRGADGGAGDADHAARSTSAASSTPEATELVDDRARLVVDLAAVPGRQPAVLAAPSSASSSRGRRRRCRCSTWSSTPPWRPRSTSRSGSPGIVLGTVAGTVAMCVAQGWILRRELDGIDGARTARTIVLLMLAAARCSAVASYGVWYGLDAALGRSLIAQAISVLGGIGAGIGVYGAAVWLLRVPEARQIQTPAAVAPALADAPPG